MNWIHLNTRAGMPSTIRRVAYNRVTNSDDVDTADTAHAAVDHVDIEAPAAMTTTTMTATASPPTTASSVSRLSITAPMTASVNNKKKTKKEKHDQHSTTPSAGSSAGAHVPQIVLDPEEAQLRSQIYAQINVKLLSFGLLIITSLELLALFTIARGAPPTGTPIDGSDLTDDATSPSSGVRVWQSSDYFDLALNFFGLYSALLGIQATTENTSRLAFRYFICTVLCGIFWNAFFYYMNYKIEKTMDTEVHKHNHSAPNNNPGAADNEPPMSQRELLVQAFFAILIPLMIWVLCCLRAYQFHSLLQQAEQEAEERIQNLLSIHQDDDNDDVEHAMNHVLEVTAIATITVESH